jgi:hypothetical protein
VQPSEKTLITGVEINGFRQAIRLNWTVLQSRFRFHGSIRIRDGTWSAAGELIQAGSPAPRDKSQFRFHYVTAPKPMIVLAISAAGQLFETYGCP